MEGGHALGKAIVGAGMLISGALLLGGGAAALAVLSGWVLLAIGLAVGLEVVILSRPSGAVRTALDRLDDRFVED